MIRVVYALLLFLSAFVVFFDNLSVGAASPLAVLGKGRVMFDRLVYLQFAGVYLFMPAITCGVVTLEKERASLPLLFLTRLGPWTIVLEKLMSRVIPMIGFLLLSLPLLAFAYSLGGITVEQLAGALWMLVLAVFQMGTLAILCSTFFRTTVGAFVGSYLLGLVLLFGTYMLWLIAFLLGTPVDRILNSIAGGPGSTFIPVLILPFCGFATWIDGPGMRGASHFWPLAVQTGLILATSGLFLVLARSFLVSRAFVPPRNVVLGAFKRIDRVFQRLNDNRFTRGIVLGGDGASMPEDEPVAWRETQKRSLGRARYLMRVFIALEIPVAVLCFIINLSVNSCSQRPQARGHGGDPVSVVGDCRADGGRAVGQPDRGGEVAPDARRAMHDAAVGAGDRLAEISLRPQLDYRSLGAIRHYLILSLCRTLWYMGFYLRSPVQPSNSRCAGLPGGLADSLGGDLSAAGGVAVHRGRHENSHAGPGHHCRSHRGGWSRGASFRSLLVTMPLEIFS